MALLLNTPEQHGFQDPTLELNEKRLAERLASLPVLDIGESLRIVLGDLEPLNEQQLDSGKRLRLLGLYQRAARRLFETAAPAQLRQQPLSQQRRQDAVDGVERLCLGLANGYKIVIKEMYAAGAQTTDAALFGQVLRWGVIQLATALLHNYRYYRPEPPFVFLELNQLYRLARHYGVHEKTHDDDASGIEASLASVYQAVCLLALTDPFSAEEGQADRSFTTLLHYAPRARIIPGNSWQDVPEGLFFLDLQSDSRPRHCVFLQAPVSADDPCILDARVALGDMHNTLAALPADKRKRRSEVAILRHLLPEVTGRDKRRNERRADGRWIDIVTGLEAVHEWLSRFQRGEQPRAMRWQVRDSSDSGYRLAWNESAATLLQVGDLVCIVADSTRARATFRLMVVRWIRNERGEGTELGVELFEGVPGPVRLVADEQPQQSCVALFLPSTGAPGSVARLVAPAE
ncbi:MAG: hypothetical protein J5I92_16235, partial [Thiogranum sp.]|nr:hypothetical protein [Thiogranum sp.]